MKKLSPSQENYLEWIYRFSLIGPVKVRYLAEKLGVRVPSVSRAVSGLVKFGLVDHETYGDIVLTEEGKIAGECIVRRDECLTKLLVDLLGMSLDEADPHIHQLEHVLGEEVLNRLEVLIEFCLSSEAWMKRLLHRIDNRSPQDELCSYLIGATSVHAGLSHEKVSSK